MLEFFRGLFKSRKTKEQEEIAKYKKDNETLIARLGAAQGNIAELNEKLRRMQGGRFLVEEELRILKQDFLALSAKKVGSKKKAKKKAKK